MRGPPFRVWTTNNARTTNTQATKLAGLAARQDGMPKIPILLVIAVAVSAPALRAQAKPRPDSLALARQATIWFYTAQFDSLIAHHEAQSRGDSTLAARYAQQLAFLTERAGTEVIVLDEKFVRRGGQPQYWRTATFTDFAEPLLIRWVVVDGQIAGMGMGPLSQAPPIDP